MEWFTIIEKAFWAGAAAIGFGVLFNVPVRTLFFVFVLGVCGSFVKFTLIESGANVVIAAFVGATVVGFLSIWTSLSKHAPPLVFSIPAVIPMVPGIFAYRTMIGLINLTATADANYMQVLAETCNNGAKASFILMSLSVGVGIPHLITRKDSAKEMVIDTKRRIVVKAKKKRR